VIGAIDLGSNTIKLTVARPGAQGGIEELLLAAETVRLGAGLGATGRLADDRIEAALAVLREYAATARDLGATRLIGVATEATRRAANGPAFLERVHLETGWEVKVISGDEEADLTFRGIALHGELGGLVVIADIGGASTELIVADSGTVVTSRSVAVGSGTLTDTLVVADPPTDAELAACSAEAAATIATVAMPTEPARLIAVGGTAEYLAQLVGGNPAVSRLDLDVALAICQAQPSDLLATTLSIPPPRARVLPAGIAVIRALADMLGSGQVEVAASGIRTGLLLDTFAEIRSAAMKDES
jgi:exopolyphosphatase/guanosine-5'-triphosphate,3'-diphosphate pyrophosphatase